MSTRDSAEQTRGQSTGHPTHSATSRTMRAVVLRQPGGPANLVLSALRLPRPGPGWVRIAVRAFGLNRSELHTRLGLSQGVSFPRVLGIEAVGVIDELPEGESDGSLALGQQVATMLGGMGRAFDGGYAEYVVVPRQQVIPFNSGLTWAALGSVPETLQTAHGSLSTGLNLQPGQTLLIRGGTSALGLVGTPTLPDTLRATRMHGTVCFSGMLSNRWTVEEFYPIDYIPRGVRLTAYAGGASDLLAPVLQAYLDRLAAGELAIGPLHSYTLEEIPRAHEDLENNRVFGKLVGVIAPAELNITVQR